MKIKSFTEDKYAIRIITPPYSGREHIFGKVITIGCAYENCPLCNDFGRSQPYWLIGAIDRSNNEYTVFKFVFNFFNRLMNYAKNPDWGDPRSYDIEIYTNPVGIFACPKTILSDNDRLQDNEINRDALETYTKPWSTDRFNKAYEKFKNKLIVLV